MKLSPGEFIYKAFCKHRFPERVVAEIPFAECNESIRKAWACAESQFTAHLRDETKLVCAALAGMDIDRELDASVYAVRAFAIVDAVRAERERRLNERSQP